MRYCTTICTSTMFRSPEIISASSRKGVTSAASLERKPSSMRRVSVTSTTSPLSHRRGPPPLQTFLGDGVALHGAEQPQGGVFRRG